MNIYQKLIEVRKSVQYLKKDAKGYSFNYVSSSQTLGTLRGKMDEMGLLLVPSILEDEVRNHTTAKGNHEYFTKVSIKFTWINAEKPEETIESMWIGQGLDSGEKGVGKACTYAEKYFLLKFFNIATDKDDPDSFQKKFSGNEKILPPLTLDNKPAWTRAIEVYKSDGDFKRVEAAMSMSEKHKDLIIATVNEMQEAA